MQIQLTRGCIVPGHPQAKPGDVLEVANDVGQDLLAIGKAIRAPANKTAPEPIQTREPAIETRDPVIDKAPKRKQSKLA